MNNNRDISFRLCLVLPTLFIFTGCPSQKQISRDFRQNRQRSYELLVRNRQDQKDQGQNDIKSIVITGSVTKENCFELAFKHNKQLQIAKKRLQEAQGQTIEATSTALPTSTFSGQALARDDIFFESKESYDLQVLIRQPLYLGGLIGTALDAAAVFTYQTRQELRQTMQSVRYNVHRLYLAALLAEELLTVSLQSKRDADKLLADTRKRLRHGAGTKFEVLRSKVRLISIEAEIIKRQNDLQVSKARLLNELGISQSSTIELTQKLSYDPIEISSDQCLLQAMKQRPDLLIGEATVRLAQDNLEAEKAGDRPKAYLQGTYARNYPGFGSFFQGNSWDRTMNAGLVVEWPFFDGLKTLGKVTKAKALLQQRRINLTKMEQQAQLEVNEALLNLRNSEEFVKSQQGNVDTAEESLRLVRVAYREGAGSSLDVISAELALAQARSDYFQSVHGYLLARLNLTKAMGIIGEQSPPQSPAPEIYPSGMRIPGKAR